MPSWLPYRIALVLAFVAVALLCSPPSRRPEPETKAERLKRLQQRLQDFKPSDLPQLERQTPREMWKQ